MSDINQSKGNLKISGLGYDTAPNWDEPSYGTNAGTMYYDTSHGELFLRDVYDLSNVFQNKQNGLIDLHIL